MFRDISVEGLWLDVDEERTFPLWVRLPTALMRVVHPCSSSHNGVMVARGESLAPLPPPAARVTLTMHTVDVGE